MVLLQKSDHQWLFFSCSLSSKLSTICAEQCPAHFGAMEPLVDPAEHSADPKAKKMMKKKGSDMKDGEWKSQRTSKRIKTLDLECYFELPFDFLLNYVWKAHP
ncbi:hypothetical protein MKW98_018372, partial [Papaver atlanticum]